MIKQFSNNIFDSLKEDFNDEDRKWLNVYNEFQYRIDTIFEALVSFYTSGVLLMHLSIYKSNPTFNRSIDPLRLKNFIYMSYIFTELHNLLDAKGRSSITRFVGYWNDSLLEGDDNFKSIFGTYVDTTKLNMHFSNFQNWLIDKEKLIYHIKYARDKNFSHVDHDYEYNNSIKYEDLIETVTYISDYLSILNTILGMINLVGVDSKIVSRQEFVLNTISIEILEYRFMEELDGLILKHINNITENSRENLILNCKDSINETLKRLSLISF